jgi:hypothetical protein
VLHTIRTDRDGCNPLCFNFNRLAETIKIQAMKNEVSFIPVLLLLKTVQPTEEAQSFLLLLNVCKSISK